MSTAVRAELVEACARLCGGGSSSKPGLAPAGEALFFASPKKSTQKKGDPMVWVPPLRCGQPAVLAKNGVELELASLRQSLALIHFSLRSSAQPDGWGAEIQTPIRGGKDALCASLPEPGPESAPVPDPTTLLYAPRSAGPDGSGLALFERSEFSQTPAGPSTAGCPPQRQRRRDADSRVAFSLVTFFWRDKRKLLAAGQPPACWRTTNQRRAEVAGEHGSGSSPGGPANLIPQTWPV